MSKFGNNFTLDSHTGAQLNVYCTKAKGKACGIVHINHGLAEHALRYAGFADALSKAGFHVFAPDHRGHGFTKAADAPAGVFSQGTDGVNKVLEDCADVQAHAIKKYPGLPLVMFGHSMGAIITMNYVLKKPQTLAGAAVWNTNFDAGLLGRLAQLILKYERFRLGSDVPSRILPKLTFEDWAKKVPDKRTNFDWLSRIESEVDAYISDSLCGWDPSVGMWLNIFEMVFAGGAPGKNANAGAIEVPIQLLGGGNDPSTNFGQAISNQVKRLEASRFENVQSYILPDARHETLNDLDAKDATAHFIQFAKSCCSE